MFNFNRAKTKNMSFSSKFWIYNKKLLIFLIRGVLNKDKIHRESKL